MNVDLLSEQLRVLRLPAFWGKPVREALVVVGEQDAQGETGRSPAGSSKTRGGLLGVLPGGAPLDLPGGAVDGDKQIGSAVLVGHRRQVLDVHVEAPGLVVLEGLRFRLPLLAAGPRARYWRPRGGPAAVAAWSDSGPAG